ncbi:MAG: hypothetical protein NVS1B10_04500 [Candidatus Saccharimonadales bacterium]
MIKKIKNYILSALLLTTFATPALVPAIAMAASGGCDTIGTNVADGANQASGGTSISCDSANVSGDSIGNAAQSIVKIFSIIVGVVAVIMIIYGGFRYITSGGDSGKVGSAKNSLIYAIVGLVIVALAQLIVHFVLNQTTNISSN